MGATTSGPSRPIKETKSTALVHWALTVPITKQTCTTGRDQSRKEQLWEGKSIRPLKGRREEYKHSTTKTRDPSLLRGIHFTGENTTAECHSLATHPPPRQVLSPTSSLSRQQAEPRCSQEPSPTGSQLRALPYLQPPHPGGCSGSPPLSL